MSSRPIRTLRRAAERREQKLAKKAAKLNQQQEGQQQDQPPVQPPTPESPVSAEAPATKPISEARRQQNWENAQYSTGPKSTVNSSQNHTVHGLARHNGDFRLLKSEDSTAFEALRQSLAAKHQPSTPTECILVNGMAEAHWLANRDLISKTPVSIPKLAPPPTKKCSPSICAIRAVTRVPFTSA